MHVIFANTGVQYVCEPLRGGGRYPASAIGLGWQYCEMQEGSSRRKLHFVQWRIASDKLFLAIDTTCGDADKGYFCSIDALAGDYPLTIAGLLDLEGKPLANLPRIDVIIRPATGGSESAKRVHMVIDFGNSRTGSLLIEPQQGDSPDMEPFELVNRYLLDAWDETGAFVKKHSARWFNSRTNWCMAPYQRPQRLEIKIYTDQAPKKGFFSSSKKPDGQTVFVTPRLFQDLSGVRMGLEAEDVAQRVRTEGDILLGLSSPKRYLWADDEAWLEGDVWNMCDPDDRCGTRDYVALLQGPLIRYLDEEDPDELRLPDPTDPQIREDELAREVPLKPRHAPRVMMVAAIYEMLSQAYCYVNSPAYRALLGDPQRHREIHGLSLSYPSGMIQQERERFQKQVEKAVELFSCSIGRTQSHRPVAKLTIDEASAVHLTYIWSELQMLNRDVRLWFQCVGRARPEALAADTAAAATPAATSTLRPPTRPSVTARRPPGRATRTEPLTDNREVRIACIDIGGGTSDLMVARYTNTGGVVDRIDGEVLHRDGISLAGDQLVKRLLERIIVPHFAECVGMGPDEVARLFGPELPSNRSFRAQRISWMNRLFVPLAQQYLQHAVDENVDEPISHIESEYVSEEVVSAFETTVNEIYQAGMFNIRQPLSLYYDPQLFEDVVHDVFDELLFDFCERISQHDVDIVLLAGQPTKLRYLQDRVRMYLPLPADRVIPMHNYYAGTWYPYQGDSAQLGVIVDPKSAVVVGAAIQSLMHEGLLGNIRFQMKDATHTGKAGAGVSTNQNSYFWGLMTEGTTRIREDKVIFQPEEANNRFDLQVVAERILIGRRKSPHTHSEASPVWLLKVDKQHRHGPIDLVATIERVRPSAAHEETLKLVSVKGTIAGEDAFMDGPDANVTFKWQTLVDERYYLDTGALDNIEGIPTGHG